RQPGGRQGRRLRAARRRPVLGLHARPGDLDRGPQGVRPRRPARQAHGRGRLGRRQPAGAAVLLRRGGGPMRLAWWLLACALALALELPLGAQDLAVHGRIVHTQAGAPIEDGVVLVQGGKITAVGPARAVTVPAGLTTLEAAVVVPGLVDAHCCLGLAGALNYAHDRDELEHSSALQPELRAIDAYNPREPLLEWARSFG